jgi:hypothetical protein
MLFHLKIKTIITCTQAFKSKKKKGVKITVKTQQCINISIYEYTNIYIYTIYIHYVYILYIYVLILLC